MAEVFSDDLNLKIGDMLSRPLVCARARTRLRDRYTRAPVVACARSRSRLRPPYARTRFSLRAANA
jgi:hypothetical protein